MLSSASVNGITRKGEEEERPVKAVGMAKQGAWTRWEGVTELKISWEDLWKVEPERMQFMLKSTYDLLPTPSNLVLWNKKEDTACALCKCYANLKHILSCCKVAITQGRYRWRHDQVLRVIAESIEKLRRGKAAGKPSNNIVFVKEGTSLLRSRSKGQKNLMSTADDWKLEVDLNKKLVFPREIVMTNLRPDIVLSSQKAKTVVMIELTVPWEDHIEEANERKRLKYVGGWRLVLEVFQLSRSIIFYQCLVLKVKKEGQLLRISVKQQRGHLTGFGLRVVR